MKTLFAIIGGAVVLGAASAGYYHLVYLPSRRISFEKIDYLAKSVDWKTSFASGTVTIDELMKWPDKTMGINKGSSSLTMQRVSDNIIKFTLICDGKTTQVTEIDFVKRNIPS